MEADNKNGGGRMSEGNKGGQPTKFTPEIGIEICRLLIAGNSLPTICKKDGMPCKATVYNWLAEADKKEGNEELMQFLDRYTRARQLQPDALVDECLDIADDGENDWYEKQNRDGSTSQAFDKENVMRSKLRVETRITMAERLNPKKYRPSSAIDHTITEPPPVIYITEPAKKDGE